MRTLFIKLIFIILIASTGCHQVQNDKKRAAPPGKNEMADLNRYLIQKDRERIQNYIERKNLKMTETSTGLWYQIIKQGDGSFFSENSNVTMTYDCSLLDGTGCYSSEKLGPKRVVLGKSQVEQGLNEGLRLLSPGAEAIFIIPPFLAFGLIGDRNMVPPRAVIVYNVKILITE